MEPRVDIRKYLKSDAVQAMFKLGKAVEASGLERSLLGLIEVRASQINHCAYCIDMHWKDARARGETEQRLYGLDAWRESPYYSERERAALEWIEAITRVAETQVPDEVYEQVRRHFDEEQLVALTFAAVTINAWNRLSISMRAPAGTYQPQAVHA
ncbi:MAG TPA: carboxymuconolactone decarboxylase family protein [Vicinamibacterales bacterium]|nr:carboxymuconolactone decarboxylase family protein [Vicinamibacterales bacterium]